MDIKNTSEAIGFVADVIVDYGKWQASGRKLDAQAIAMALQLIQEAPAVVDGIGLIPAELADLDAGEGAALVNLVGLKLGITNEKTKLVIEAALEIAAGSLKMAKALKSA